MINLDKQHRVSDFILFLAVFGMIIVALGAVYYIQYQL